MLSPRHRRTPVSVTLALALALVPAAAAGAPTLVNRVLATVDGEPVTLHDLRQFATRHIRGRQLAAHADEAQLLEALIIEKLVQREASAQGIVVRDEDVDQYVATIKERNDLDDAALARALANQGLTLESYRAQIREDILRQQLIAREIRGKVTVTPEDVQRHYEAHADEYTVPERVQVAHIFFRVDPVADPDGSAALARARAVHERLQQGADFAELAREHSEDASAADGGSLGWFRPGELLDDLDTLARTLPVGRHSGPVRTRAGVHILKIEAREGGARKPLEELADRIREELQQRAVEERFQRYVTDELRRRHHVELIP